MAEETMRLQRYMAQCGVASRRKSEEIITAGRVRVNTHVATIGQKVTPRKDEVTVDGEIIRQQELDKYIMLHKPRGYITTMSDSHGGKTVAELVGDIKERVYPIGRLDKTSEGLLIMTNDGIFAHKMMHPSSQVEKIYHVTVSPVINDEQIEKLSAGIVIENHKTAPTEVLLLENREDRSSIQIILTEGRNRQIRRMCEAIGLRVLRLRRVAVEKIELGDLPLGEHRELTAGEINHLMQHIKMI